MKTIWRRIIGKRVELKVKAKNFTWWPFNVEAGVLVCDVREGSPVTFITGGKTYALNGVARAMAEDEGWEIDLDAIRLRDPTFGNFVPLYPIIQHALGRAGWDT